MLLFLLSTIGCTRAAVREDTEEVPSSKSEKQLLEERLGI
jgi:hypothetical protein